MVKISYIYSEVYNFINALGDEYISKVPVKIYNIFKNKRNKSYNPIFHANQELKDGELSKFSLAIIAVLYTTYWCTNIQDKKRLINIYKNNSNK